MACLVVLKCPCLFILVVIRSPWPPLSFPVAPDNLCHKPGLLRQLPLLHICQVNYAGQNCHLGGQVYVVQINSGSVQWKQKVSQKRLKVNGDDITNLKLFFVVFHFCYIFIGLKGLQ